MKMNMAVGILLFGVSLFTNCLCKIEDKVTKFENAKHFCEFQNLSLLSYGEKLVEEVLRTNFTGKLWIGKPWYKEIDCYKTDPNKTIPGGSLYNCSTHCNGFDHIGLQEHNCACFNNFKEIPEKKCTRKDKLQTNTESLKFGTDDTNDWFMYKKESWESNKRNVVHVSEQRIFQITQADKETLKFICYSENTTATKKTTAKKPQSGVSLTTPDYRNNDEELNLVSDNSYVIPAVAVSGIAALLICVVVVVILKKRNHTEIAREEMEVMEHNYSSVQKVGRPTIENPSYDVDVSMNKPQVDLKENEGNADTNVYDTAGASNNTQSNSSEIYDHTNSTEGVYDVTDHVKQKENDADNTYDHV